jgi:glycosyltransferase involved in cell wall biosynthesis
MIGGPKSLYNLLSLFPPESLVVLTSAEAIDPLSAGTGAWLPARYIFFDREEGAGFRGNGAPDGTPSREFVPSRTPDPVRRFRILGRNAVEVLYLLRNVPKIVRTARRAIREHRITMLLGISDDGPALIGTYLAHRYSGLPYALYLFDLYRGNDLSWALRTVARIAEPRLLREAAVVVTTNEATEELLRSRYGDSFRSEVVHNSAFPEDFERSRRTETSRSPYTIVFTGNVYWAQEHAVLNLVQAMDLLRDLPVRLLLYVPSPTAKIRDAAAGRPNVELTRAPQAEVARVQCKATLLFLPLSWGTKAPEIIATATPGKLTDYLASGRPMLVHAPDYACVARITREHGTGIVVDRDDVQALADAIREFLRDPSAADRYVGNALRMFEARHDARKNSRRLWAILGRAAAHLSRAPGN